MEFDQGLSREEEGIARTASAGTEGKEVEMTERRQWVGGVSEKVGRRGHARDWIELDYMGVR